MRASRTPLPENLTSLRFSGALFNNQIARAKTTFFASALNLPKTFGYLKRGECGALKCALAKAKITLFRRSSRQHSRFALLGKARMRASRTPLPKNLTPL